MELIEKLVFSISGYFSGCEIGTYKVSGETVSLGVEHTLHPKPVNFSTGHLFTKEEFVAGLRAIHIGEWKKNYENPFVLDGTQWELKIYFSGSRKPIIISGSNAYPYNFNDLTSVFIMRLAALFPKPKKF